MWQIWHSAKECHNNLTAANQDQTHNSPTKIQPIEPIRYPTLISPTRPPILTKKITADIQLSQEVWNKLSNQMNEMAETNKLLTKVVKNTYKN